MLKYLDLRDNLISNVDEDLLNRLKNLEEFYLESADRSCRYEIKSTIVNFS